MIMVNVIDYVSAANRSLATDPKTMNCVPTVQTYSHMAWGLVRRRQWG